MSAQKSDPFRGDDNFINRPVNTEIYKSDPFRANGNFDVPHLQRVPGYEEYVKSENQRGEVVPRQRATQRNQQSAEQTVSSRKHYQNANKESHEENTFIRHKRPSEYVPHSVEMEQVPKPRRPRENSDLFRGTGDVVELKAEYKNRIAKNFTDIGTEEQIPTRRVSSKSNYSCKEDILGERQYPMNVVQGKTVIDLRQPQFTEEQARAVQMEGRKAALEYKNKRNQSEW